IHEVAQVEALQAFEVGAGRGLNVCRNTVFRKTDAVQRRRGDHLHGFDILGRVFVRCGCEVRRPGGKEEQEPGAVPGGTEVRMITWMKANLQSFSCSAYGLREQHRRGRVTSRLRARDKIAAPRPRVAEGARNHCTAIRQPSAVLPAPAKNQSRAAPWNSRDGQWIPPSSTRSSTSYPSRRRIAQFRSAISSNGKTVSCVPCSRRMRGWGSVGEIAALSKTTKPAAQPMTAENRRGFESPTASA